MVEWQTRLTQNQVSSGRAGSSPVTAIKMLLNQASHLIVWSFFYFSAHDKIITNSVLEVMCSEQTEIKIIR